MAGRWMAIKRAAACDALPGLRVTSPAPLEAWLALIEADPEALAPQSPAWMRAMVATGQYADASRLYEFPGGRRLVLPLARRTGPPEPLATFAALPPTWSLGGLVGSETLRVEEAAAVFADLAAGPGLRVSLRPNPVFVAAWEAARPPDVVALPKRSHILDLSGGFGEVWSHRFASETRTAVRKAERSGLEVIRDTTGAHISEFYELFQRSVARWAGMQHEPLWLARFRARLRDPRSKFHHMARALGPDFRLWIARKDGRPAAAVLVVMGRNASYIRGAMDKDLAGPTRANQLLQRLAIEDACDSGCRRYHMGESGASTSLAQYKERFGAVPVDYAEYFIEKIPLTAWDAAARGAVKRLIGFKDAD